MELAARFDHYYMNTAHYNNNSNSNIDERYEYWKPYALAGERVTQWEGERRFEWTSDCAVRSACWIAESKRKLSGDATMDLNQPDVRVIRAPSLKRGKSDNGLNERVSRKLYFILFR